MASFVLVPGAWHGSWCWERVAPLLQAAGHAVIAAELGPAEAQDRRTDLARWADHVADRARAAAAPVLLVGHSRGGIVISEAAERAPDRIGMLVYVAAFLVGRGETVLDMVRRGGGSPDRLMASNGDGTVSLLPGLLQSRLYAGTAPDWVARAALRVRPEPAAPFATRLQLTDGGFGRVRRAYIGCRRDRVVPPAMQRLMLDRLPCDPVLMIEADHCPFYSNPAALAAALLDLADRSATERHLQP